MFKSKLEFKGAVIGMLLGDGCLPQRNRKSKYLCFSHAIKDKEYLDYKVEALKYLTKVTVGEGVAKLNGKEYPYVSARTLSHPLYSSLSNHMYYSGRKTVDEHVLKCLTPFGLALWYCDDGTLAGEQGFRNPYICSHNFNKVENELLARLVHKKFDVTFRVISKNIKDKSYFWLRLRRKDRDKFFALIREYVPKCMQRKIDPSYYTSDEKYQKMCEVECSYCGELFLAKNKSQANNCQKCNEKSLRDGHTNYYSNKKNERKFVCVQCGVEFIRKPGKETIHCSRLCAGLTHSNFWKTKRSDQAQPEDIVRPLQ